jgi:hypothetical protein
MELTEELETRLFEENKAIEEAEDMSVLTTAERIGMKKGFEQGISQGIEKSMPAIHQAIATIIKIKFGEPGQQLSKRAYQLRRLETLQNLMEKLEHAQSLPEAEKIFDEMELQN